MFSPAAPSNDCEGSIHYLCLELMAYCVFGPFSKEPSHIRPMQLKNGKDENETPEEAAAVTGQSGSFSRVQQKKIDNLKRKDRTGTEVDDTDEALIASINKIQRSLTYEGVLQRHQMKIDTLKTLISVTEGAARAVHVKALMDAAGNIPMQTDETEAGAPPRTQAQ